MFVAKDFQRIRRMGRYLRQDKRRLLIILFALIPLALAGAIQPLLVGQVISVLRGEPTLEWLADLSMSSAVRILLGILFLSNIILIQCHS